MVHSGETWYRLRNWQGSQAEEERMAAQVLAADGYESLDPSHPLGGPDGGRDGRCKKDGKPWIMAVYFSRGERTVPEIEKKLVLDVESARKHSPHGVVFVTNQELRLSERADLESRGGDIEIDIFHLERVAHILDQPRMSPVREQYLGIAASRPPMFITAEVLGAARTFTDDDRLLDFLVKCFERDLRKKSEEAWKIKEAEERDASAAGPWGLPRNILPDIELPTANVDLLRQFGLASEPDPPKLLTDEQILLETAAYREELSSRWSSCTDYLASAAWPGLKFRLQNKEKGFLTNVEVVLTFHGCRGVDSLPVEYFEWQKVENPDWEPYSAQQLAMMGISSSASLALPPKDYPVEYDHDDDGNLRVTITLPELRPRKLWTSNDDEVVLRLRDVDLDQVTVTFSATAYEHDDLYEGEPITVPVDKLSALKCYSDSHHAAEEARG